MDWDLRNLTWEQKALLGLGVVTLIILIFVFGSFNNPSPTLNSTNQTYIPVTPQPVPVNPPTNGSNGSNNSSDNGNITITRDQAKEIAAEAGYEVGEPTLENINVNDQSVQVWKVPLLRNDVIEKEVYVDTTNGKIVATRTYNS